MKVQGEKEETNLQFNLDSHLGIKPVRLRQSFHLAGTIRPRHPVPVRRQL